jgi:enoyl-CoA hydratase
LAARAAAGPPELVRKLKATLYAMATVTDHHDAVMAELEPQAWSVGQPEFAERIAALRSQISRR